MCLPLFYSCFAFLNTPDSGPRTLQGSGPGDCNLRSLFGIALTEHFTALGIVGLVYH